MMQPGQQPTTALLYANFFEIVCFGPEDFYIECGVAQNAENGERVARIITPPAAAKRLMLRLQRAIADYEEAAGGEIYIGSDDDAEQPSKLMPRRQAKFMKKRAGK